MTDWTVHSTCQSYFPPWLRVKVAFESYNTYKKSGSLREQWNKVRLGTDPGSRGYVTKYLRPWLQVPYQDADKG
jgi:hypothetical protein